MSSFTAIVIAMVGLLVFFAAGLWHAWHEHDPWK